ncbi:2-oxo acid dehydrogenase subunit E2 [Cryptosporangium minutisporangium]|uniref:Dihydrolipoamide acetyltransferase component of pyruvate dehydrogenase complex n=1 Tax=Cryptosporangium minutisporangium TaxID=113569 RepID=A0ABP6T0M0_9ACTN
MTEVRIPKLNSNDTTYTLVSWLVAAGAAVRAGDLVATVETSKAAEDLASDADGVLHQLIGEGSDCAVGQVIGRVLPVSVDPAGAATATDGDAGPIITEPARRLMAERGIDLAAVRALNRPLIRTADIEALAPRAEAPDSAPAEAGAESGRVEPLSPVQRAVAAVVSASHRSIPTGFVAIRVPVDAALRHAQELTGVHRCLIGLPELVVASLGAVAERFPYCFGAYVEPDAVRLAERIDVGVTIDVGQGLHVPVVRDVAATPLADIAKTLMRFRLTAMRGTFRAGDLTGASVLLALHTDEDVSVAVPMVLPGTVCALSLGGNERVVQLDAAGAPVAHTVVQLGVAYDHRVVNGAQAVELLRAIREVLLAPATLAPASTPRSS